MFRIKPLFNLSKCCFTTAFKHNPHNVIEQLKQRTLLRISGDGASEFLQGLITNDMKHLENGTGSMYTMFLNVRGRVMYDAIIYNTEEQNTFLIECDSDGASPLEKHLKMYRVRRKIDIAGIDNELLVFVSFDLSKAPDLTNISINNTDIKIHPGTSLKHSVSNDCVISKSDGYQKVYAYHDPRLIDLGIRILASPNSNLQEFGTMSETTEYKYFLYKFGIGEGANDLPPGNCFPLEANCDYLHGISFHKGCYIGQELTARTYHTGVIRKRLMPLYFVTPPKKTWEAGEAVVANGTKIGKIRGIEKDVGLGLVRTVQALQVKEIEICGITAKTIKPYWWPLEAPKEIISERNVKQ